MAKKQEMTLLVATNEDGYEMNNSDTGNGAMSKHVDINLLNLIANNINDIIVITYKNGWCQYISPSVQKVLGYSSQELIGVLLPKFLHPDDMQHIKKLYDMAAAGIPLKKSRFEYRFRRKDGSYAWMQSEATRIFDDEGNFTKALVISRNITDQKGIEEAQREKEKRLRQFEKAISAVGMIMDEDGRHIEVYGQNNKLLVRPKEELRGLTLHQVFPVHDADHILSRIRQIIQTGRPQQFICELEINGVKRNVEGRSVPMDYLVNGKKTVAAVLTDVTEKQRVEKKLELALVLRRGTDFIDDIIQGQTLDTRVIATAELMGIDLFTPLFCCLIHIEKINQKQAEDDFAFTIIDLLSSDSKLFVWDCRGDIGIIYQNLNMANDLDEARQATDCLMEKITAYDQNLIVTIGVGGTYSGLEGIKKSYRQAMSAAIVARCREESGNAICHFQQIGIYQFLEHFSDEAQAREFVHGQIGKLLGYDSKKGTDLLHTLEEILQSASLKEAAAKLYLHYNTVVFRKRRIENILEVSIGDFETRLALATAVKLQRLIYKK